LPDQKAYPYVALTNTVATLF